MPLANTSIKSPLTEDELNAVGQYIERAVVASLIHLAPRRFPRLALVSRMLPLLIAGKSDLEVARAANAGRWLSMTGNPVWDKRAVSRLRVEFEPLVRFVARERSNPSKNIQLFRDIAQTVLDGADYDSWRAEVASCGGTQAEQTR